MDILSPAATDHSQTPPIFHRSFTVPTASNVSPRSPPSIQEAVEEGAETLYAHHGKIVSFDPPISGARRHSSVEQAYSALHHEPVGTLPWASATERTLAAGPLRIYRVLGTVAFLESGNRLSKPILAKSQCWCVDGESKFVLQAGPHTYYRIELPTTNADDRAKVDDFKTTLSKVLQYETTPCPFKRGFTVDLPEKPKTPVRKRPWKPREPAQPAPAAEGPERVGRGFRRWQRSTTPIDQPHATDLSDKGEDTVSECTDSVSEDSAEGSESSQESKIADELEMTPRDSMSHAHRELDPFKTPTRPRTMKTGRATTAPPQLLLYTSLSDAASEDNEQPDIQEDVLAETSTTDVEPLFILEFLHRIIDVFEEFIGGPLLASRIESSYDVVAQLLGEMCDAGSVCNTEPNALRDDVDIPGWMDKLLGGVGLPGSSPASLPSGGLKHQLKLTPSSNGPAIPWRRANVRHTSNELYVDILETLHVTLAPSGRPLAAIANGSIAFTSKTSGVPDLLLTLSASGGKLGLEKAIELPVFHPCVRLARWRERPGELSFVPPDGKFMLAGYEVDLMPSIHDLKSWSNVNLQLPVSIEVSKSLGPAGTDFEVRLAIYNTFPGVSSAAPAPRPALGSRGSGVSTPVFSGGTSASPALQDLVVTIPIPGAVRSVIDLRASRGEAYFTASESVVEWRISTKAAASPGTATLRCTVVGPLAETDNEDMANGFHSSPGAGDYDEHRDAYQSSSTEPVKKPSTREQQQDPQDSRRVQQNSALMPASASVSFSVKGWLASGIKVDGLNIDTRKSRGLGEGVKPYKGVKYLTVSKNGIETRC
ncbi:MAG: hypothetical protein LQ344_000517 [Seirophora lacunosa]|nr:MAG: hypothetical protein LQ344_000517 [Seirophora lacunosa]